MSDIRLSKESNLGFSEVLGLPEHITIVIARSGDNGEKGEAYLVNKNISAYSKEKLYFGTYESALDMAKKWAIEITGEKVFLGDSSKPEDKYDVLSVSPRHKPMTQFSGPRSTMVIVTNKETGKIIAVDYCKSAHKNKIETIRLHEEDEVKTAKANKILKEKGWK